MKKNPRNKGRAARADAALIRHAETMGVEQPARTALVDLLTDIRHLCDARRVSFDAILKTSADHYYSETVKGE